MQAFDPATMYRMLLGALLNVSLTALFSAQLVVTAISTA
jgi:hypothetical protein